jgi:hypothetical protein
LLGQFYSELDLFKSGSTLDARNNVLRKLLRLFVRQFSVTIS